MSTYGPKNPQIINAPGWTNPNDAKISDGNPASKLIPAGIKESLVASKFQIGMSPPRPGTIKATVTLHADGPGVKVEDAQLLYNGNPVGSDKADFHELATSPETLTYTFMENLPGPAMVNQDSFGIQFGLKANLAAQTANIDGITIEVEN